MSKVPKFHFEDYPPAKPAKVAKLYSGEAPQASPPACPVTCAAACHWYASNPWSHDPTLLGWCHRQMVHLVVGSLACEEFRHGEVPPRQNHERVLQVPAPRERVLTCFECPMHEHDPINPPEGWGSCTLKNRGCYGLRPACSEIPPRDGNGPLDG